MTLELSQALSSLMVRTTEESPENFDIHIHSYNRTTNRHLTCRLIPKTLTSFTSRKESTDTESSKESALIQMLPVENNKKAESPIRQGRLEETKAPTYLGAPIQKIRKGATSMKAIAWKNALPPL